MSKQMIDKAQDETDAINGFKTRIGEGYLSNLVWNIRNRYLSTGCQAFTSEEMQSVVEGFLEELATTKAEQTAELRAEVERLRDDNEELFGKLTEAVELGQSQAADIQRFWDLVGMGTSETTVDDVMTHWNQREAKLTELREREKRIAQAAKYVLKAEHTSSVGYKILNRVVADIDKALADRTDGGGE